MGECVGQYKHSCEGAYGGGVLLIAVCFEFGNCFVCVHVCMCMCMCAHVHVCVRVCACVCVRVRACAVVPLLSWSTKLISLRCMGSGAVAKLGIAMPPIGTPVVHGCRGQPQGICDVK